MWIFPQIGWRSVSGATLVVSAALLGGCVVAPVDPGYAYSYTTYGSPPPVRYEAVPVAPSAGYVGRRACGCGAARAMTGAQGTGVHDSQAGGHEEATATMAVIGAMAVIAAVVTGMGVDEG